MTNEWEHVCDTGGRLYLTMTKRLKVPGGWLYRTVVLLSSTVSADIAMFFDSAHVSMVFVPEVRTQELLTDLDHESCLKHLPSYGPNEDGDYPDCDCRACRGVTEARAR
jgi:hypothetical protein